MTKENANSVEKIVGKKLARRMLDVMADLEPIKKSKGRYEHYKHGEVQSAVMGLLPKHGLLMITTPSIVKREDRYIVVMHAKFINCDDYDDFFETSTEVFLDLEATNMSPEQLSGSAQSYALKYTLQRTFGLGGEKDPDDIDNAEPKEKYLTPKQVDEIRKRVKTKENEQYVIKYFGATCLEKVFLKNYGLLMNFIGNCEKNAKINNLNGGEQ